MPTPASNLAIIIPLKFGEHIPKTLLRCLPDNCAIYLVASGVAGGKTINVKLPRNVTLLHCEGNRARALNLGITVATQLDHHTSFPLYYWLLHADSQLPDSAVSKLCKVITPARIYYAKLQFTDGPPMLRLNAFFANVRSKLLNMPFGDQGFCFSQQIWQQTGPFAEDAAFGEDNLFIKRSRQQGIGLQQLPFKITTSGRTYTKHGWLTTTIRHVWYGHRQRWGAS